MDIITMENFKDIASAQSGWCVSLFMPAHRRGRDTEQDTIRFKNLLSEAEKRLLAKGLRSPDVQAMFKPAQNMLQESPFWWHQSDGLAAFINSESCRFYRLPLALKELVVVSDRFHVKPLLPFLTSDGHFYILALSQNQVRLLEGTRYTVDEIDLENMPTSIAEALQFERFEQHLQFHTGSSAEGGKRPAMFHGHSLGDEEKARILRWFHKIDDELSDLLTGEHSPLVLAGVDYLFPLYKEANSYPHLIEEGIRGNPEELKPDELHTQAWSLAQPVFMQEQQKADARYNQLAGTGQTTADVQEAVLAAHHGRVDVLFVAVGVQVWGSVDLDTNTVHVHQDSISGDEDLLDLAAIQTILNGGTVYAVEPGQVPAQSPLAAVYRY